MRLIHHRGGGSIKHRCAATVVSLYDGARRSVRHVVINQVAVLMPRSDAEAAKQMAERIRDRFQVAAAETLESHTTGNIKVTMSMGMSLCMNHHAATGEQLMRQADMALYKAKISDKDCVRIFDRSMAA